MEQNREVRKVQAARPKTDRPKTDRRRTILSDKQIEEMRQRFFEGVSLHAIAREFKCGTKRVRQVCQKLDRPLLQARREFDSEQIQEIRYLFSQGISITDLRKKFHCDGDRIHAALGTNPNRSRPKLTPEEQEDVRSRHEAGESISSICRSYERDRWVIYGVLGKKRVK
jgi:DNA invertase Pin-like site-specific DNA recombinase